MIFGFLSKLRAGMLVLEILWNLKKHQDSYPTPLKFHQLKEGREDKARKGKARGEIAHEQRSRHTSAPKSRRGAGCQDAREARESNQRQSPTY